MLCPLKTTLFKGCFFMVFLCVFLFWQVEGVPEFASSSFTLLLNLYALDSEQFCDTSKAFYFTLLERLLKLPWEAKAKYHRLCALLPHVGAELVSK